MFDGLYIVILVIEHYLIFISCDSQLFIFSCSVFTYHTWFVYRQVFLVFFKPIREVSQIGKVQQWHRHIETLLDEKSGAVDGLLDAYLQASMSNMK